MLWCLQSISIIRAISTARFRSNLAWQIRLFSLKWQSVSLPAVRVSLTQHVLAAFASQHLVIPGDTRRGSISCWNITIVIVVILMSFFLNESYSTIKKSSKLKSKKKKINIWPSAVTNCRRELIGISKKKNKNFAEHFLRTRRKWLRKYFFKVIVTFLLSFFKIILFPMIFL